MARDKKTTLDEQTGHVQLWQVARHAIKLIHLACVRVAKGKIFPLPVNPPNPTAHVRAEDIVPSDLLQRDVHIVNSYQHDARVLGLIVQDLVVHLRCSQARPSIRIKVQEDLPVISITIGLRLHTVRAAVNAHTNIASRHKRFHRRLNALPIASVKVLPLWGSIEEPKRGVLLRGINEIRPSGDMPPSHVDTVVCRLYQLVRPGL